VLLWIAVLKSGVHATLAGVVLAFFIPLREKNQEGHSPLHELEHNLHPSVAFVILPVFAFSNAGISFADVSINSILEPVPLGIALGLLIGKQIGVFGFSWIAVRLGVASLPENVTWTALYGIAILAGIGFTMSLFIGTLAFEVGGPENIDDRLGILPGSLISALLGYFYLKSVLTRRKSEITVNT
jgi:NhaA family Na+:H+ antiporter